MLMHAYLVHGSSISEDEVDGAFDVAIIEVVTAGVVAKCVLRAVKSASEEVGLVAGDAESHSLPPLQSW